MYIYHALISTLSTHMIHVNLNMIFCTLRTQTVWVDRLVQEFPVPELLSLACSS